MCVGLIGSNKLYDGALQLFPLYYFQIEILKRLQRETFSDIMKLRDRQEKVERMLLFHKSTKGSPFQELSTHVQGTVDVAGALLFVDEIDQQSCDIAGMRTGINSKFTFETTIRQNDSLVAEFVACPNAQGPSDEYFGSPLSLTKVMYSANVKDWISAVVVPWGARCRDVAVTSNPLQQERSLTDFSSLGPPMLNKCHGSAVGFMVKKTNIAASVGGLVSEQRLELDSEITQLGPVETRNCFSGFGEVIYQLSKGTTLTLLGIHKRLIKPSQRSSLRKFTIPLGSLKRRETVDVSVDSPISPITGNTEGIGSIALVLESELDDSTRVGGWVEMQNSNSRCLQWAVTMSDTPEEELGWGLSMGGITQGPSSWDHFQAEAFLRFNMGKRCSLMPGIVYVMDGTRRFPAVMFRSSWSL
ncbi:GDSL esterase/lipase [Thalictrum thalictroides]|uniref:GDSL esterase/lipase n=1 Tax=Thalictrum thalictroides TaxID=46969 RepID=A0A7J6V1F7_THATH|nr:GDSL esterase/lipase [Thalictrum thalictroides]